MRHKMPNPLLGNPEGIALVSLCQRRSDGDSQQGSEEIPAPSLLIPKGKHHRDELCSSQGMMFAPMNARNDPQKSQERTKKLPNPLQRFVTLLDLVFSCAPLAAEGIKQR